MKIDNSIKLFLKKYDEEAMKSIDDIQNDIGLVYNKHKIELFNINECFDKFNEFITGYAKYKIDNINNENASENETIYEKTKIFINDLFKEYLIPYERLTTFVECYINGIKNTIKNMEEIKNLMMENNIDLDSLGFVNDLVDEFTEKLTESFDKSMDKILLATGYTTSKILDKNNKKEKTTFI